MTPVAPSDPARESPDDVDAIQRWATESVRPIDRPGVLARALTALIAATERLNLRFARLGNPCIYDNEAFAWVAALERDWQLIRDELADAVCRRGELPNIQDITPDAASITRDNGWKILMLVAYGIRSPPGIAACPQTWRIVRAIPGLRTAMFSVFEPGKRLPPHRGPYNGVLRLHLGLIVPEPRERLGIRVGPQLRSWREGKVLIFDDAYEHEAWNETDRQRVVLFVDFEKPLRFPFNLWNRAVLSLARLSPQLVEGAEKLRAWEHRYYGA